MFGAQTEYGKLKRVLMHRPGAELRWVCDDTYREYNYRRPVDVAKFQGEYDALVESVSEAGAEVVLLTDVLKDEPDALTYIARRPNMCYTRDLAVVTNGGVILLSMALKGRKGDPQIIGLAMKKLGVPVLGTIDAPGLLEGGGIQFMDERTALIALCDRANEVAIKQFCDLTLGTHLDEVVMVMVPDGNIHIDGQLMFVAPKLALGYMAGLDLHPSVVFRAGKQPQYTFFSEYMQRRGVEIIETTTEERRAMSINFIATAPLEAVGWTWATRLSDELRKRGGTVWSVDGEELVNGNGGPHCLTCPIEREKG
ncbi:MAG: arginine deiminase family protein [Chloroflexota bacterium]